jgi:hypothetical protein
MKHVREQCSQDRVTAGASAVAGIVPGFGRVDTPSISHHQVKQGQRGVGRRMNRRLERIGFKCKTWVVLCLCSRVLKWQVWHLHLWGITRSIVGCIPPTVGRATRLKPHVIRNAQSSKETPCVEGSGERTAVPITRILPTPHLVLNARQLDNPPPNHYSISNSAPGSITYSLQYTSDDDHNC